MTSLRTAIVTGAGSGIGRATTHALVADGWHVALAGRREEALAKSAAESADPSRTLVIPTDVRHPESVSALFEQVRATWGRIDLLFNNAGVNPHSIPLEDLPIEKWRDAVDTNLTGMFLCIQTAFRYMKAQEPMGGRIINNGSISAYAPRPDSAAYTATKHAVLGLTKCASLDGRKYDIACGQIDIGNAASDMAGRMAKGVKQADGRIVPEAMMDVREVGRAVVHMASLPLDTNVQFMTVMATKMPFLGRG